MYPSIARWLTFLCILHGYYGNDIRMVFKDRLPADWDDIVFSIEHKTEEGMHLLCSSYKYATTLQYVLDSSVLASHPVYLSKQENSICHVTFGQVNEVSDISTRHSLIRAEKLPLSIKMDRSVHIVHNAILAGSPLHAVDIDISVGVGVRGKGLDLTDTSEVVEHIFQQSKTLNIDNEARRKYTQQLDVSAVEGKEKRVDVSKHRRKISDAFSVACDFSRSPSEQLQSHVSIRLTSSQFKSHTSYANCLLQLTFLAMLNSGVTHIAVHPAPVLLNEGAASEPYLSGSPATDQNAFVQSASESDKPYSDIGLTGHGYVLGMIDSGIDDLSCFLANDDDSETPRTSRENYGNPTTEINRRK